MKRFVLAVILMAGCSPSESSTIVPLVPQATRPASAATAKPTEPPDAKPTEPPEVEVYYENCTAVRDAGEAPLGRDDPGYRPGLDRDDDGVACE